MITLSNSLLLNLLAVIVLGASGSYLLLPHAHGRTKPALAHRVGIGLCALSVIAFMLLWQTTDVALVSKLFFYLFGFGAVFCAILTVTSRDPVHSALWFAAVVLATSGLFLLSGAQFLAAGTVIVYAGAIIVTFLFVIMLAQKEGRAIYDRMARAPFLATLASFLLLLGLIYSILGLRPIVAGPGPAGDLERANSRSNRVTPAIERLDPRSKLSAPQRLVMNKALPPSALLPEATGRNVSGAHVAGLGATLYTEHLVTVELAGALLFAALIGALAIATPKAPVRPSTGLVPPNPGPNLPIA